MKIKNILLLIIFVSLFGVLFGANSPRCIYQAKQINQKHHVETTIKKFDLIDKILKTSRNPVSKINKRDWHNEKFRYATRSHKLLGYIFYILQRIRTQPYSCIIERVKKTIEKILSLKNVNVNEVRVEKFVDNTKHTYSLPEVTYGHMDPRILEEYFLSEACNNFTKNNLIDLKNIFTYTMYLLTGGSAEYKLDFKYEYKIQHRSNNYNHKYSSSTYKRPIYNCNNKYVIYKIFSNKSIKKQSHKISKLEEKLAHMMCTYYFPDDSPIIKRDFSLISHNFKYDYSPTRDFLDNDSEYWKSIKDLVIEKYPEFIEKIDQILLAKNNKTIEIEDQKAQTKLLVSRDARKARTQDKRLKK